MTTPKTNKPFRLSSTLAGHNSDVRSISSSPKGPIIFSSSRDGTARSWYRESSQPDGEDSAMDGEGGKGSEGIGGGWKEGIVFQGSHDGFVGACQFVGDEGNGYLVTAGQDKLINIWPLPSSVIPGSESVPNPTHTLLGHEGNVCALNASTDGKRLISGSWDKTAKVWDTSNFQLKYTLEGHEQAVWAVLALDGEDDLVLTGAADNLVKLWKGSKVKSTYKGHTQAVRALAKLDSSVGGGDLFSSAGNDGTIRIWSLATGESIHILYGHDSFVYSLSPIPGSAGGGLVSGGEDRTMRIWRAVDGECEQAIVVPAVSVWSVACLSNGDIVAGSSDGLVRVFTRVEARVADLESLTAYDQQVSKTAVNSSQVGAINKNDLLGSEALQQPGQKEGQVKVIKNEAGGAEAYQWSSSTGWVSVGEVVDAVGSDRKQLYQGQEYDYVFDVDITEGAPPLKLPYNASQNPYEAAQKFLFANELPLEYMDQVVAFIEKSTEGVTLGATSNEYVDPYTGASRYTGGGAGSRPAAPASGFTGDPYTGGGRTVAPAVVNLLPHRTFLNFTRANLPALRTKIGQLNDIISADATTTELALSASEITILDEIIVAAESTSAKAIKEAHTAVILRLLNWPAAHVFPALDLVRVVSRFAPISESIPLLLHLSEKTSGPTKEQETNTMLTFRALANVFTTKAGQTLMTDEASEIIDMLSRRGFIGVSKNGKVALATIALNYSVLAGQDKLDSSSAKALYEFVGDLLRDADGEVVYRALVSLGNLLMAKSYSSGIPAAGLERCKTLAKDAVKRLPESRNKAIVVEIGRV